MSWLSSFVNNNRNIISSILPGPAAVAMNALFPASQSSPKVAASVAPAVRSGLSAQMVQNPQAPSIKPGKSISGGGGTTDSLGISLKGITHVKRTGGSVTLGANATPQQVAAASQGGGTRRQQVNALRAAQGLPPLKKRINPLNIKALKRSVRRLKGFHKAAVRVERALHLGRATSHRHVVRPATANVRIVER